MSTSEQFTLSVGEILKDAETIQNFSELMQIPSEKASFSHPRVESYTLSDDDNPQWLVAVAGIVGGGDETHVVSVPSHSTLPSYINTYQARLVYVFENGAMVYHQDDLSVLDAEEVIPSRKLYVFEDLA